MRKTLAVLTAAGLLASSALMGTVGASERRVSAGDERERGNKRSMTNGLVDTPYEMSLRQELYSPPGGLPKSKENMKLLGKLKLTDTVGAIADVAVHKGYAYLGNWITACGGAPAEVKIVDVRKPKNPRLAASVPNTGNDWSGEGIHVMSVNTNKFKGDLLLMSSEPCDPGGPDYGGIHLVDVTNPRNPKILARNVGDTDPGDGSDQGYSNATHSVMGWTVGKKAYAVMVDNEEWDDVDIMDISDPKNPKLISETGILNWLDDADLSSLGRQATVFHHDMQVKRVRNKWHILVSYWDLGWVLLDVSNPSNPKFVTNSVYPTVDPLTGFSPPEGNAHQAWWNHNNNLILATDEDFDAYRLTLKIEGGPFSGQVIEPSQGSDTPQVGPDAVVEGTIRYFGRGCPDDPEEPDIPPGGDPMPPAQGPGEIALIERGICSFTDKVQAAEAAGYEAAVIFNHNVGCEGTQGMLAEAGIPALGVVARSDGFKLLGIEGYDPDTCGPAENVALPVEGTQGVDISSTAEFDGWGYVHLLDGKTLGHLDAYAVPEALDPRYAERFGTLSVHEVKTDRRKKNLGYISYYSAGARVVKFTRKGGIREVGHFIDGRGNDFWGTFPVKRKKKRPNLFFSDRDFGLYILRYTGPE